MHLQLLTPIVALGFLFLATLPPALHAQCEDEEAAVLQAQSQVSADQEALSGAQAHLERAEKLFEEQAVSQSYLDAAIASLAQAEANLQASILLLQAAEEALANCENAVPLPLPGQPDRVGIDTHQVIWRWASLIEPTGRYFITSQAHPAEIGRPLTFGNGETRTVVGIKPVMIWGMVVVDACFAIGELDSPIEDVVVDTWWIFPGKSLDEQNPIDYPLWEHVSNSDFRIFGPDGFTPISKSRNTGPVNEIDEFFVGQNLTSDPNEFFGAPVYCKDKLFGLFYPDLAHEQQTNERVGLVAIVSEIYSFHLTGLPAELFTEVPVKLGIARSGTGNPPILTIQYRWPETTVLLYSHDLQNWKRPGAWPGTIRVDSTPWCLKLDYDFEGDDTGKIFWQFIHGS